MLVVIDTNVIVSGLISSSGPPGIILDLVASRKIVPCFDTRIIKEYIVVLNRPKFKFNHQYIEYIIDMIKYTGVSIVPEPIDDTGFTDKSDFKFYEVAKHINSYLITGNKKHFPNDPIVFGPGEFLETHRAK